MASVITQPAEAASSDPRLLIRGLFLLVILAAELIGITYWFQAPALRDDSRWSTYLFTHSREIWRIGLWVIGSCLLLFTPRFKATLRILCEQPSEYRWPAWLALQLLAFAAFSVITAFIFETPTDPDRLSASWLAGWVALAGATFMLWLLALAPGRIWWRWLGQARLRLLLGALLGVSAWILIRPLGPFAQAAPWDSLARPTLWLVYWLLGWIYPDVVYRPENLVVGTGSFPVFIHYTCSGSEGIFLITLFLAIYCWLFRQDLRFPQAFWLFPLGVVAVWFANAVRITLLIVIGTSFSQEVALQGFHAQAGWIAFTLIAIGAIALSHRLRFFTVAEPDSRSVKARLPLATALLAPLGVLMATAMVTSAASSGFDWLYPLRVIATTATLYAFRRAYRGLGWTWTWSAPLIGAIVFLLWMLLEPTPDHRTTALSSGLAELSQGAAAVWLTFRILGSVITVPLAEEMAFRGYLLRKLIAKDFNQVKLGQFSWPSFVLTSLLFGLLHGRWLAGTLAGMGYALALYRHGQLGDAVVAHLTTNALIALVVLAQAKWYLWS